MVMSAVLGVISYVSYPMGSEKTVKFAASVLLLFTALNPILAFAQRLGDSGSESLIELPSFETDMTDGEYIKVAEEAFKEGISKLLFTKFDSEEQDAQIYVFGFDFKTMTAESIKILLVNKGVGADFRAIEEYITESGLGACEVNVRIG